MHTAPYRGRVPRTVAAQETVCFNGKDLEGMKAKRNTAMRFLLFGFSLFLIPGVSGQNGVTEIRLRTDPVKAQVRPHENLVIQVLAYGEIVEGDQSKKGRLREGGARLQIKGENSGWLSKPFRYQGEEKDPFYEKPDAGLGALIFGRARTRYVLKDAVLYTAPDRPGKYEVEAELEGKIASIMIEVDPAVATQRPPETVEFPAEPAGVDPHRPLVEHYAPLVAQETWFDPKSDYLARFDLDGDWRGDNNWDNAETGSSQAYVHYAVMETRTHWFLIYNLFHPRDYSDQCVVGTCHENDSEGLILTIEKNGSRYGQLLVMETLAHNKIYSYRADPRVRRNLHDIDGDVEFHQRSHPAIFVEAGGHGIYGTTGHHARFSLKENDFTEGTGVTYLYKGVAERPRHANDRNVGYALLPIYDFWWRRAHEGDGRGHSFDDYYRYQPYGERPRPLQEEIAGAFLGRRFGSNKAKPFWGWHDKRTLKKRVLATGQWSLDPAYGVSRNLQLPEPVSLDYLFNPFLGVGSPISRPVAVGIRPVAHPPFLDAAANLEQFAVKRSSTYDPGSRRGRFDLRLVVDGESEFFLRGEQVRFRVVSGRPPKDEGSECSQPIPPSAVREFKIFREEGRGRVILLEQPSPQNGFTAKLRISDPKRGEDRYHVRVQWERSEETGSGPARSSIFTKHLRLVPADE